MLFSTNRSSSLRTVFIILSALLGAVLLFACGTPAETPAGGEEAPTNLVLYSGRSESLVAPLIEMFQEDTGITVEVRYGGTAEMAATILEEGDNTPADVYWAQDPGGVGALAEAGRLSALPEALLNRVDAFYRDPEGQWVGVSGRARVVVYNTDTLTPEDLPADLWGFTDPAWQGRIGWAPTNGSFQVMVTAMRQVWGEEQAREWLAGIQANEPVAYPNNTAVVAGTAAREVEVGFVNHYYLYRFLAEEGQGFKARNHYLANGGPDSLVMISGAGITANAAHRAAAETFIEYLLSDKAQAYFATETFEYPTVPGIAIDPSLKPISELNGPSINLAELADLEGTINLLTEVGILP